MKVIEVALKSGEDIDWFLEYINNYYRAITMVSYESVKDQLNLLGIKLAPAADGAFYQRGGKWYVGGNDKAKQIKISILLQVLRCLNKLVKLGLKGSHEPFEKYTRFVYPILHISERKREMNMKLSKIKEGLCCRIQWKF